MLKKLSKIILIAGLSANAAFAAFVAKGDKVAVRYTGMLEDGRIFDSNVNKSKPLVFTTGSNTVLPAFENAIIGLNEGESTMVEIPAAQAYGEYDPNKIIKIKASQLPADAKPGKKLELRSYKKAIPVRLVMIDGDDAYVDANHVLAGKDLKFDIKVSAVNKTK
jgi:FKBP-type peptidyl-prolyl cis-trans isomerase 2